MPTASILLRLSKQAGDTNLSLAGMEQDCRDLCTRLGLDVYAVRVDDGISGAVRDRPAFRSWLDDGRTGAVDALVSWSGDRLTREGVNAAALVLDVIEGKDPDTGALVRSPIRFLSADDGLDSSGDPTAFRFSFVIKAEVARAERERIVARNRANQRRLRAEVGRFRGGERPYGYATAPREGGGLTLVLDPDESAIVRDLAARVLAGESLYSLARSLTAQGVPTRRGGPWRIQTLQSVLTGPHTLGQVRHRGQVLRDENGLPLRFFEPILDDDKHAALCAVIRPPSTKRHVTDTPTPARRTAGRSAKVTRLLSNLVESECCGGVMYAIKPSPAKPRALYRQPHGGTAAECRRQVSVNAEPLDEHVEREFLRRFGRFAEVRPVHAADERADLAAVEREIQSIALALAEPGADLPTLTGQLASLHERRATLAARPDSGAPRMEPTGRTIGQAWAEGTVQTRNALLALFLTGPIAVAPVGHARSVKTLDLSRVAIPWRGADPAEADYANLVDYGEGESYGPAA
jgi:site-specific DNA recombinase